MRPSRRPSRGHRNPFEITDELITPAHGGASGRISIVSYGDERPLCTEETEACWMFLTNP